MKEASELVLDISGEKGKSATSNILGVYHDIADHELLLLRPESTSPMPDNVEAGAQNSAPDTVENTATTPRVKLYFPGQIYLLYFGAFYLTVLLLLTIPYIQRNVLYFNFITIPIFADFSTPEKYGLAPNRTLNFLINTPDNETIGAWFVFSNPYYRSLPSIPTDPAAHVMPALKHSPAILFLHGNSGTRAFSSRIQLIKTLSSRLEANVLIIDYRGFGDSSGTPSEAGLVTDANTAFNWLVSHGKQADDILILGHSLGTGVSGQLGAQFGKEGIKCKGIVFLSPFTSIVKLMNDYNMFGFLPLTKPISFIPGAAELFRRVIVHRFDTLQAVPNITAPVLIGHAENDWDIPDSHSDILFQAFLDPVLPPVETPKNLLLINPESWNTFTEQHTRRREVLDKVVRTTHIPKFGRMEEFDDGKRKVVLVKTLVGGHDHLGAQEGLIDIIGKTFGFI